MAYQTIREKKSCDVLVIGSGIAGLLLAHELSSSGLSVILACKGALIDSNTSWAQGGLAAVTGMNSLDSPELHLKDTISAGAGLTNPTVARLIIEQGAALTKRLAQLGVNFDTHKGRFDAALEGGHSRARVLHSKDASGRAISTALIEALLAAPNVLILESAFALDLLMSENECVGASMLVDDLELDIRSRYTVLATGGLGQVFARTTNPLVATGDGIAMAYRAGARLVDMEFVQFHPTALVRDGAPAALISEAVRGAGAELIDGNGDRFAFRFHKDGELATRDVVARAIYTTMMEQETNSVGLDMRPIGQQKILDKFPNIVNTCRQWGIDPLVEPVPISPAAHYFMGGIYTDETGRSSIPGLLAIGECASTGLHGANRLASNSLLEGGVMAVQAARSIMGTMTKNVGGAAHPSTDPAIILQAPYPMPKDLLSFQQAMFRNVGLERSAERLIAMVDSLPNVLEYRVPSDHKLAEAANIALLGWLIARSALERKESRGAHWRSDYPLLNDTQFRRRLTVSRGGTAWVDVDTHAAVATSHHMFLAHQ